MYFLLHIQAMNQIPLLIPRASGTEFFSTSSSHLLFFSNPSAIYNNTRRILQKNDSDKILWQDSPVSDIIRSLRFMCFRQSWWGLRIRSAPVRAEQRSTGPLAPPYPRKENIALLELTTIGSCPNLGTASFFTVSKYFSFDEWAKHAHPALRHKELKHIFQFRPFCEMSEKWNLRVWGALPPSRITR